MEGQGSFVAGFDVGTENAGVENARVEITAR